MAMEPPIGASLDSSYEPVKACAACGSSPESLGGSQIMNTRIQMIVATAVLGISFPAMAQLPSVQPVTVCDVLSNTGAYRGKAIAVVGRLGGTDGGTWLDEECINHIERDGFQWPNLIWITSDPEAPSAEAVAKLIDKKVLEAKVFEVAARTKLRPKPERDEYALLYGRIDAPERFETFTYPGGAVRGIGYGHLGAAPAQLVFSGTIIRSLFEKEIRAMARKRPKPPKKRLQTDRASLLWLLQRGG